ncbi:Gfo/Idh/MocA family protein [Pontiella agarivorans]|uniref:Gfo/Idh/MocA family oxidoreductase n=1 Tax=Pontiella agarivorans TaxID=3038953 RepID=A0ABU5MX57_9BACT|nr:Gfo/Idh/MocA family oxidoreductase [Pontiella agarivorans]MDZ8118773.1 Gfo/Idh/MocA family oxidoreductase [Pontiella agarivorans]
MNWTRREGLFSGAALTAGSLIPGRVLGANEKLNCGIIGAGGMGRMCVGACGNQNIVAFADVDSVRAAPSYEKHPTVPVYTDFRKMLDKHYKELDVVLVSTPDHTHFAATLAAMERGLHVFTQKPLTHDIWQARTLQKAAHKYAVKNIMGNQGRCFDGIRQIKEWIDAGLLGDVVEVEAWTVRPYPGWGTPTGPFPRPQQPVPETLDWDNWQGPVPHRDYNECYLPNKWRAWWDYGNSAMGDIGCHLLDSVYWACDLTGPVSVKAEAKVFHDQVTGPKGIVQFNYPARGKHVPLTVKWYEGGLKPERPEDFDYGLELPNEGILIKGTKRTIYHPGIRAENPVILMSRKDWYSFRKTELPEPTIPRLKSKSPVTELFNAIKGGPKVGSDFDYAVPLTELCCLGGIARRTGKQCDWDPESMTFRDASLNRYVKQPVRRGWDAGVDLWT